MVYLERNIGAVRSFHTAAVSINHNALSTFHDSVDKLKDSELRVVLLFGHVIVQKYLKRCFYHHFLKLVIVMHHATASSIEYEDIDQISSVSKVFVHEFSILYGARHVVQVVHSVAHIGSTVANYGPLSSFTTFYFENELG
jgi:hypothetical protein